MFFKGSEEYYIKELISINKDCWRSNMTTIESWSEIKKSLKKMKLNEKDHPFLFNFRKNAFNAETQEEIQNLFSELYKYHRKCNIPVKLV